MKYNHSNAQLIQEKSYYIPYHYLDLALVKYNLIDSIEYTELLNYVVLKVIELKPFCVLDAGCGDGRLCHELAKNKIKVKGIDYSEKAIGFAQLINPNIEFRVSDLARYYTKDKVDLIILVEVLEHIPRKEVTTVVTNLKNNLIKGGKLILTVPSIRRKMQDKHYQHFSQNTLLKQLSPYFNIVELHGYAKKSKLSGFKVLQLIGYFVYPFRNYLKIINRYFGLLRKYYRKNVLLCNPSEGDGFFVVCEKK